MVGGIILSCQTLCLSHRSLLPGPRGVKPAMGALGCGGARPSGTRKDARRVQEHSKLLMLGRGFPLP